mmetsp:Transcript_23862/g.37973  ORF Transcript_23862/g.37973 Transcript_23862/m.37973 type:complete len:163 (-) Transcript_23862:1156-1644(-)
MVDSSGTQALVLQCQDADKLSAWSCCSEIRSPDIEILVRGVLSSLVDTTGSGLLWSVAAALLVAKVLQRVELQNSHDAPSPPQNRETGVPKSFDTNENGFSILVSMQGVARLCHGEIRSAAAQITALTFVNVAAVRFATASLDKGAVQKTSEAASCGLRWTF